MYADGFRFKLVDPYGAPRLYVRRLGASQEGEHASIERPLREF